jgi:hypothetical protein
MNPDEHDRCFWETGFGETGWGELGRGFLTDLDWQFKMQWLTALLNCYSLFVGNPMHVTPKKGKSDAAFASIAYRVMFVALAWMHNDVFKFVENRPITQGSGTE